jgi:hypothetical protein
MILKVYQIVTIENVRFVTFRIECQYWDGVYLNIYKRKEYPYSFKNYLIYSIYSYLDLAIYSNRISYM